MTFFTVLNVLHNFNKRHKLMQTKDTIYIILSADVAEIIVIISFIISSTRGKTMILANDEITKTDFVCLLEYQQ